MSTSHAAIAALLALAGSLAHAQATVRIPLAPASKVWVEGTSNLHAWSCTTSTIGATIDADSAAARFATFSPKLLKSVQMVVAVRSLTCDHDGMNDNTYKALNADHDPNITFTMGQFNATPPDGIAGFTVHAIGTLTIAGKTNTVAVDVVTRRLPDGSVKATGTVPIKMTDYGVKPPTALLGTLKTGDAVNVKFELTLGPKTISALGQR